jgi:hypothetical protein
MVVYCGAELGDVDYSGAMYDVLPAVMGDVTTDAWHPPATSLADRFRNLALVSDYLGLPEWIAAHEPALARQLLRDEAADALLPDGTVFNEVEAAAGRLGVAEMRRQVERIRRDHGDDSEALVGHVKELVESTCKTILGLRCSCRHLAPNASRSGVRKEKYDQVVRRLCGFLRRYGSNLRNRAVREERRGHEPGEPDNRQRDHGGGIRAYVEAGDEYGAGDRRAQ